VDQPVWEGSVADVVERVGWDKVLFGSDYPHAEGLPEPKKYYEYAEGMDEKRTWDFMGDNARRFMGLPVMNPNPVAAAAANGDSGRWRNDTTSSSTPRGLGERRDVRRDRRPRGRALPRRLHRQCVFTLLSQRAGLVMYPDAKVEMLGAQVGTVSSIEQLPGGGAAIHLRMNPSQLQLIPSNVVGGHLGYDGLRAKYVQLIPPDDPSPKPCGLVRCWIMLNMSPSKSTPCSGS